MNKFKFNLQLFAEPNQDPVPAPQPQPQPQPQDDPNKMYLEKIEELKKNSVSKEDFDKLKEQNRSLLEKIVNGEQPPAPTEGDDDWQKREKELAESLLEAPFKNGMSNYEYLTKANELRKINLEHRNRDIFQNTKSNNAYTEETANKISQLIEDCAAKCEGNPKIFDGLFMAQIDER